MYELLTTLTLGAGPTNPLDIYKALRAKQCKIGSEPAMMVEKAAMLACEPRDVNLVAPMVADLGYASGASLEEIFQKGADHGLMLCTPEVSWQLCLHCKHLLGRNDKLVIAMKPIDVMLSGPQIFAVLRIMGSLYLGAEPGIKTIRFGAKTRFVFVQSRD